MILSPEQQEVFDLCENSSNNLLVIGKPGVGKSVLINALTTTGQKYYTVAAPTGLAALNVKGKTLHSLFGIVPSEGIFQEDYNKFTTNPNVINFLKHHLTTLIIDEISMVRADMLDYIDRLLREVKGLNIPFGGVQVICFGDFFQLPPVTKIKDLKDLHAAGYESEFAFDAKIFENNFSVRVLEQVHRQSDPVFLELLHAARSGKINGKHLELLRKHVSRPDDLRPSLTPLNYQADKINSSKLAEIKLPAKSFEATKFGYWPASPVDNLTLKVGAQVMVKKNGADIPPMSKTTDGSQVVSGSLAKVVELPTEDRPTILVELENGNTVPIYIARWERKEKEKIGDKWTEKTVASYEQYPLQLAWAISMHKSQGQTFDKVHINPQSVFAAGQFYVALSRVRSLEGLSLESTPSQRAFMVDKRVLEFTNGLTTMV